MLQQARIVVFSWYPARSRRDNHFLFALKRFLLCLVVLCHEFVPKLSSKSFAKYLQFDRETQLNVREVRFMCSQTCFKIPKTSDTRAIRIVVWILSLHYF